MKGLDFGCFWPLLSLSSFLVLHAGHGDDDDDVANNK